MHTKGDLVAKKRGDYESLMLTKGLMYTKGDFESLMLTKGLMQSVA